MDIKIEKKTERIKEIKYFFLYYILKKFFLDSLKEICSLNFQKFSLDLKNFLEF